MVIISIVHYWAVETLRAASAGRPFLARKNDLHAGMMATKGYLRYLKSDCPGNLSCQLRSLNASTPGLTQIEAELPQITDSEIAEAVKLLYAKSACCVRHFCERTRRVRSLTAIVIVVLTNDLSGPPVSCHLMDIISCQFSVRYMVTAWRAARPEEGYCHLKLSLLS